MNTVMMKKVKMSMTKNMIKKMKKTTMMPIKTMMIIMMMKRKGKTKGKKS